MQSIDVTPTNPSITKGKTEQFTATGTFTDGSTKDLTSLVTWDSATSTVATVTQSGLATGVGTGTTKVGTTSAGSWVRRY